MMNFQKITFGMKMLAAGASLASVMLIGMSSTQAQTIHTYRAAPAQVRAHIKTSPHLKRNISVGNVHRNLSRSIAVINANPNRYRQLRSTGIGFGFYQPFSSGFSYGYGVAPGFYNQLGSSYYLNQIPLFAVKPPVYYKLSDVQPAAAPTVVSSKPKVVSRPEPKVIVNPFWRPTKTKKATKKAKPKAATKSKKMESKTKVKRSKKSRTKKSSKGKSKASKTGYSDVKKTAKACPTDKGKTKKNNLL